MLARLEGLISARPPSERIICRGGAARPDPDPSAMPLEIRDARALQNSAGSAAALFADHGFALLDHRSAVRHWRPDGETPDELARVYHPEIDALLRETLFAGQRVEIDQRLGPVFRGGPEDSIYGRMVHHDYGPTAGDFALYLERTSSAEEARDWAARYEREEVVGCMVISCWRTIGMREPLRHLPLAICDPRTVAMADVVTYTDAVPGTRHIAGLRYNPEQRWYHYPEMTSDELLAFKVFECRKDDPGPERLRSVFHAAVDDPSMPAAAEHRHSFEHRVMVTVLRD
jgi:hypothetical protein